MAHLSGWLAATGRGVDALSGLVVRSVTLRHKMLVECRVEIVPAAAGADPMISLSPDDARALAFMLRRHAAEVTPG